MPPLVDARLLGCVHEHVTELANREAVASGEADTAWGGEVVVQLTEGLAVGLSGRLGALVRGVVEDELHLVLEDPAALLAYFIPEALIQKITLKIKIFCFKEV